LGGVLESAFGPLLTTAPVFFVFASVPDYRAFGSALLRADLISIYGWERAAAVLGYVVYLVAVLSFDFSVLPVEFLGLFENPLIGFSDPNVAIIKGTADYRLLVTVVFVGSVLAAVFPYVWRRQR